MNTNSHGSGSSIVVRELSARWRSAGEVTGAREDGRRWSLESSGGGGSRMQERERGSEREQTARWGRNGESGLGLRMERAAGSGYGLYMRMRRPVGWAGFVGCGLPCWAK